jgi:hypothetical protein
MSGMESEKHVLKNMRCPRIPLRTQKIHIERTCKKFWKKREA